PPRHLAELAHELKTPLSAIVAAAEVMRDERLGSIGTPLYRGYAADIHESASHALQVIAAMLAPEAQVNRSGREAPVYVELDVNELVRRL
ncbi:histidine kinase dimerization/phospho-acceptor domain-containing protein, partial [Staphylococcus aureus]